MSLLLQKPLVEIGENREGIQLSFFQLDDPVLKQIRDEIAGFYTDLTRYNQLLRGFDESSNVFWDSYQRHVTWDYNPESTNTDILLSTYDWEGLRNDERFLFDIIGLLRNQLVAEEGMVALRDQARALCETLADAIGRTCD